MSSINAKIAAQITMIVGTMECAYAFLIFALVPLFVPKAEMIVMFISSSVLQLVLLPLIMVGSRVLNQESENRAIQDHKVLLDELDQLKSIRSDIDKIFQLLSISKDFV